MLVGVGKDDLTRLAKAGVIFAGLSFVVGVGAVWVVDGFENQNWANLGIYAAVCVAMALLFPAVGGMVWMLRVRVSDKTVAQLLGPCVIAARPLADVERIDLSGSLFPVIFVFRDGTRMRVLGVPIMRLEGIVKTLLARHPGLNIDGSELLMREAAERADATDKAR